MKKIAFFTPDLEIGGIEKVFLDYARSLNKCEYNVSFILVNKRGTLLTEIPSSIKIYELKGERLRYILFSLTKLLRKEKFDYVISGTEKTNIIAVVSNWLAGDNIKIVTSQHNFMDVESIPFIHKFILPFFLKKSHFTFAVSECIRSMLMEIGIPSKKIEVLYNPININRINTMAKEAAQYKLPNKYVLFVGRFYPVKNLPFLLNAFMIFSKRYSDYYLVMVGDGEQKTLLADLAVSLGITDKIIWTGAIRNPYPYIKNASIVTLTSLSESLSNIVLESICLGKTVVTTPCEGPKEIIKNSQYGYISNNFYDIYDFADKMEEAINVPIDKDKLLVYSKQYDISISVSKLKKILTYWRN